MIVLAWLRKEPMDLKTFVQNRVAKIQELYPNQLWRHVPSDQNPADLVSRGVDPEKLLQQNLWFNGPTFLSAVHIELVSDLTSQAFIAALKRFMARRGKCAKLFSDNGKNFVGASNEIKKLLEIVRKPDEKLANYLAAEGIEWKFIPARSPNFGGLWEAAINNNDCMVKPVQCGRYVSSVNEQRPLAACKEKREYASKKAYETVAYLRIELNEGNIISSFVASKGRVAPLKTLSIPRLELMGALLSARLSDKIATALILPVSRFYWTDSSITCYWIKGDFNKHKVFVKNRIKEIQKLSDPKEWRYCKGKDNPADLISRGLPLNDLKNNKIWWHGPKWLTMKQIEWSLFSEPVIKTEINNDKLELKKSINVNTAVEKRQIENNLISRYSSFSKLIRISALCLRFIYNCKVNPVLRKIDCISASEFDHVTKVLVKQVQLNEFLTEIKCLKNGQPIPKGSKISSLNVFLDEDEILRVGGRLKHSTPSEFQKYQMMLPKAHHLTDLIIEHYHKKSLHSGLQTTYLIRQFYWIPSGQNRVRRILTL
ncbi:integrase catalytic domain-containing protein [Trichonephila clavipes]|nr:integrase catalytic domain-containing protein [Trichonephila clavipes]